MRHALTDARFAGSSLLTRSSHYKSSSQSPIRTHLTKVQAQSAQRSHSLSTDYSITMRVHLRVELD